MFVLEHHSHSKHMCRVDFYCQIFTTAFLLPVIQYAVQFVHPSIIIFMLGFCHQFCQSKEKQKCFTFLLQIIDRYNLMRSIINNHDIMEVSFGSSLYILYTSYWIQILRKQDIFLCLELFFPKLPWTDPLHICLPFVPDKSEYHSSPARHALYHDHSILLYKNNNRCTLICILHVYI